MAGLARSLPFMQALHGQTVVIVDGGAASDAHTRASFAQDIALLALTGIHPIVVQSVPAASDPKSVHTTHAAMAGVNHELVRLIGSHGARAVGIDGHDGGLLVASAESDHANTSEVARFDVTALNAFLDNGLVPVVMPVAPDDAGHDRLLRPERLGSLFAQRTGAVTLVMMVDSPWLRELGELAGLYGITELEQWLAEHPAADAAPCVRDALDALAHGVQNVHLADIGQPESLIDELLTEEGSGVVFCRRGNTDLLSETRRYFADSACVLRDGFSVEQKPVVRF
ncbi:acetylglutamate kinase [Burkholderia orbicola]|nr:MULTISPECIES: acetylglutamate kinase [Burkholderia cepacia complex]MCA8087966.1 acetylglutamate kinase [Burkholderia cenocepacia]MDN7469564.1 acetylglutamate kinase [Burkholderia orbicola]MDN7502432.1 acetylglutamate kinase [Burkholderia orbicola]